MGWLHRATKGGGGAILFKRLRNSEAAKGYLMLSPTAIFSIVVMAAPLLAVVIFSFMTAGYLKIIWTPTLANYVTVFTDPIYSALLERSLWMSGTVAVVTVLSAFPVAYFISFHVDPSRKSLWLFLITIPFWTSYLIRVGLLHIS